MSDRQRRMLAQKEATKFKKRMIEKVLTNSKVGRPAFNLNFLVDGWLEIESDPGTFSLLLEDLGCNGAQVDEVYDLEQKFDSPVMGFIFLFKWLHNQTNERNRTQKPNAIGSTNGPDESNENMLEKHWTYVTNEETVSEMFFAKQMISNSCATHALISIILNCDHDKLDLGPILTRLREHTRTMDPESKGYAIGNLPELAKAHNSHASYSSLYNRNAGAHSGSGMSYMLSGNQRTNSQQHKNHEAYHFVSFIPINNKLYELDGLKRHPIDHGPIMPDEDWTEKFRKVIKQRIQENKSLSNEIRYNLMAVVPDKRCSIQNRLKKLKLNHRVVEECIKRISNPNAFEIPNPPYSPLSNGTITASETGSLCNSPGSFTSENEEEADRFFLIKFESCRNKKLEEDNQEHAHKDSYRPVKPSNLTPLDLSKSVSDTQNSSQKSSGEISDDASKVTVNTQNSTIANPMVGRPPIVQSFQANSAHIVGETVRSNDVRAHSNELYNLSSKPPFDFNILDNLQHVHFGKPVLKDLNHLSERMIKEIKKYENSLRDEQDKRLKFKIDNSRRTHNYEPFIIAFLSMLAKQGSLANLIEKDLGFSIENAATTSIPSVPTLTSESTEQSETKVRLVSNVTAPPKPKPITTPIAVKRPGTGGQVGRPPKIRPATEPSNPGPVIPPKPKYKYVSTGRPVGRPRKYPLVVPPNQEKKLT